MISIKLARQSRCLAGILLMFTCGCGVGGGVGQTADPGQAQNALRAALDVWKAGGKPEDLAKLTPAILIRDLDWHDGFQLVKYTGGAEGKRVGYDMNYPVVLELKSPKGGAVKRTAVYTITTHPVLLVMRQEG